MPEQADGDPGVLLLTQGPPESAPPPPQDPLQVALRSFARQFACSSPAEAMRQASRQLLQTVRATDRVPQLTELLTGVGARYAEVESAQRAGLAVDANGYIVSITPRHLGRNHFPIAHEIGHILLFESLATDPQALARMVHGRTDRIIEQLCDIAAGELLMPEAEFIRESDRLPLSVDRLRDLADRYTTSLPSVLVRLTEIRSGRSHCDALQPGWQPSRTL